MNILFISENYPPYIEGGAEISTSLIARWLAKDNAVSVACSQFRKESWIENSVVVYPILSRASVGAKSIFSSIKYAFDIVTIPLASSVRVLQLIRKLKPDVVNIVMTPYYFTPIILAVKFFTDVPIFIDCRDYSLMCPAQFRDNEIVDPTHPHHGFTCLSKGYRTNNWFLRLFAGPFAIYESLVFNLYKSLLRFVINTQKGILLVPNSQYVQNQLVLNGFRKDKTVMINNISQLSDVEGVVEKSPIPTFTYAGRIEKEKGIWDLVGAVEKLVAEGSNPFVVNIAGLGADYEQLKKYVADKNIASITVLGKVAPEEVIRLYQTSLAIVAPSRWPEPFGRFILESIATGTPVIATRTGGTTEGVEDGVTGILVDSVNPDQLAEGMRRFIENPELSNEMAPEIIKKRAKYNSDFIGNKRISLYSSF